MVILYIGVFDKVLMFIFPYFIITPTSKMFVDTVPVVIFLKQKTPMCSTTSYPEQAVYKER